MSDEAAYMELGLGNTQGELTPLEVGMHAYARQVGKTKQYISCCTRLPDRETVKSA